MGKQTFEGETCDLGVVEVDEEVIEELDGSAVESGRFGWRSADDESLSVRKARRREDESGMSGVGRGVGS